MARGDACRTAIIEDHVLFRDTIASVVETFDGLELGPQCGTAAEALDTFERDEPDVALIDYSLPDASAPDLIADLRRRWPGIRCVVLSGHRHRSKVERSLDAGAVAYVLKGRPSEFDEAIRAVLAGETYVSADVYADEH